MDRIHCHVGLSLEPMNEQDLSHLVARAWSRCVPSNWQIHCFGDLVATGSEGISHKPVALPPSYHHRAVATGGRSQPQTATSLTTSSHCRSHPSWSLSSAGVEPTSSTLDSSAPHVHRDLHVIPRCFPFDLLHAALVQLQDQKALYTRTGATKLKRRAGRITCKRHPFTSDFAGTALKTKSRESGRGLRNI